jgi:hypothetical protein
VGALWYAAGLAGALFGLGAAYGHIVQMVVYGDCAGLFLYSEIAVSLLILGLLLAYKVLDQRAQTQPAASVPV